MQVCRSVRFWLSSLCSTSASRAISNSFWRALQSTAMRPITSSASIKVCVSCSRHEPCCERARTADFAVDFPEWWLRGFSLVVLDLHFGHILLALWNEDSASGSVGWTFESCRGFLTRSSPAPRGAFGVVHHCWDDWYHSLLALEVICA